MQVFRRTPVWFLLSCVWFSLGTCRAETDLYPQAPPRDLAVFAVYNAPPFAVTFRTQPSYAFREALEALEDDDSDTPLISETDGVNSQLSFPIRTITQTFLLERFEINIKALSTSSDDYNDVYKELVGVNLDVKLYLQSGGDNLSGRRFLRNAVVLVAEVYPTLEFEEPEDVSKKPSNEQVRALFGKWLDDMFTNHRDQYVAELKQSNQDLLREISALEVNTNLGTKKANTKSAYASGWTRRTLRALYTLTALLGVVGLAWIALFVQQRRKHSRMVVFDEDEVNSLSLEPPPRIHRSSSMDAVRHGADTFHRSSVTAASAAMDATNRYLSKHRPDLYKDDPNGGHPISVFGREYIIPSNPFESLFSTSLSPKQPQSPNSRELFMSPAGAPPKRSSLSSTRRSSLEAQKENLAASGEPTPYDDHIEDDEDDEPIISSTEQWPSGGGYRPISSIWRNLSSAFSEVRQRQEPEQDGLAIYPGELELPENYYHDKPEDDADYNFAFQDFPRHDGTPCLIYNEESLKQQQRSNIFTIADDFDDEALAEEVATTPVSDAAFQQMLSQNSLNSSFEDIQFDQDRDEKKLDDSAPLSSAKSKGFQEKLSHLMETKFRRYEQKSIIEKHQQKRALERKQVRELERRERHMAMERDIEEIEAAFSNPIERVRYSPKAGRYSEQMTFSPKHTASPARQYSPKVQQRYHQAFRSSPRRDRTRSLSFHDDETNSQGGRLPGRLSPYRSAASPSHGPGGYRPNPRTVFNDTAKPDWQNEPTGYIRPRSHRSYTQRHGSTSSVDELGLDQLKMPVMQQSLGRVEGVGVGVGSKHPSPLSVADEPFRASGAAGRPKPNASALHRRINSFDAGLQRDASRGVRLPPRRTPSKQGFIHRRANSQTTGHRRTRSHSRSKSHSNDDVFLHGIVAQTRFV